MKNLSTLVARRNHKAPLTPMPSPLVQRHGGNGAPPKRPAIAAPAPGGGRKPTIAHRTKTGVDQGKRIVGLMQMAAYQKKHPHPHLSKANLAVWNVTWMYVLTVLLAARMILLVVDDSDDPVTDRNIVWNLICYAKKQAASIHARFPREPESGDENAALWGTYLG